ncbi:MAG TPA: hypothetical protein VGG45_04310 [Terracidiphilus sp.]|jgi:hypothetical protein
MNLRLLTIVKWLAGASVFIVLSYLVAHGFALIMLHWNYGAVAPWFARHEISRMGWRVFAVCMFCGALYASALAKPAAFGSISRTLKHLGLSYLLAFLGCITLVRLTLLNYPELKTMFELRAYVDCMVGVSILCFVSALAIWVHCVFADSQNAESGASEPAPTGT